MKPPRKNPDHVVLAMHGDELVMKCTRCGLFTVPTMNEIEKLMLLADVFPLVHEKCEAKP